MQIKSTRKLNQELEFLRNMVAAKVLVLPAVDTTAIDAKIDKFTARLEAEDDPDFKESYRARLEQLNAERETLLSDDGALVNLIDLYYPESAVGGKSVVKMQDGAYNFGVTGKAKFQVKVVGHLTHIFRNDSYYLSVPNMSPSRLSHTIVALGKNSQDNRTVDEESRTVWNVVKNGQIRLSRDESLTLDVPTNTQVFTVKDRF